MEAFKEPDGWPELSGCQGSRDKGSSVPLLRSHSGNARVTSRLFGNSPQTSYRWKRRHNPRHLGSLEDRSRRPRQVRQRSYSRELVAGVLRLREQYPSWGKDKLVVLLRQEGFECSASTVGGIVLRLKEDGVSLVSLAPLRSVLLHEHPA